MAILDDSVNATSSDVKIVLDRPLECSVGSVVWQGKCSPYQTYQLNELASNIGMAGDHLLAVNVTNIKSLFSDQYSNVVSLDFFSVPVQNKLVRFNAAPSASVFDKSCGPSNCKYSFPQTGLLFVSWHLDEPNQNLTFRASLTMCPTQGTWDDPVFEMGIDCNQPLFSNPTSNWQRVSNLVSPLSTVLFVTDATDAFDFYRFGVTGLWNVSSASLRASSFGFPSPYLGEEIIANVLVNDTIVIDLPNHGKNMRWFVRLDFDGTLSDFVWWSSDNCPAACSSNGICNPTTGWCACKERSGDPILCTYVPVISAQWIIVIVIVFSIVSAVIIAWIVRCMRERRMKKVRYAEI